MNRSLFHRIAPVFAACAVLATAAFAQLNTADLSGHVSDTSGAAVAGATIVLRNPATGLERRTISQQDGTYTILAIAPGNYVLSIEAKGMQAIRDQSLKLTVGAQEQFNATLRAGTVEQTTNVTAQAPVIEATRSDTSTTIDQTMIDNVPRRTRDYINATLLDSRMTRDNQPVLAPAPTSGLNSSGQRARANSVTIDGVEANDAAINGVRSTLSQEAVQEFQLLNNGYQAEYGRAAAAVVNIVSKQGTNETRGDVFAYLRNRNLDAANAFAGEPNSPDTRLQSGFTVGGPVIKNKTFYFASFETTQQHSTGYSLVGRDNFGLMAVPNPFGPVNVPLSQATTIVANANAVALLTPQQAQFIQRMLPLAAQSQQAAAAASTYYVLAGAAANAAINGNVAGNGFAVSGPTSRVFPLTTIPLPASFTPLQSLVGDYPATNKSYFGSLRLDQQISSSNSLFLRASLAPSTVTGVPSNGENETTGLNSFSRTTSTATHDFSLAGQLLTSRGANWLNELHAQASRHSLDLEPASHSIGVELPGIASFGEEPFSPELRVEKHFQIADNVSHIVGRHQIKFGVDSEYLPISAVFPLNQAGLYFFPSTLPVSDSIFSANGNTLGPLWSGFNAPDFSVAQAYGFGLPQAFVQQFGGQSRASDRFHDTILGLFVQDSFRVSRVLTVNAGLRYDADFTPLFPPANATMAFAQNAMGITKGIPHNYHDFSPRLGVAIDPSGNGTSVIRANFGIFYGHPLLGLGFLTDIVDGVKSPYLIAPHLVGADDCFEGMAFTPLGIVCSPSLGYNPTQQRFNVESPVFLNQSLALGSSPVLPQILPAAANFKFDYTEQGGLAYERQLNNATSLGFQYNFTHGLHLLRPRNINQGNSELIRLYDQALAGQGGQLAQLVQTLECLPGPNGCVNVAPLGRLIFNDFRPTGPNYTWAQTSLQIPMATLRGMAAAFRLPTGPAAGLVPYSNVKEYESSGASSYNGLTINFNHRYNSRFQMLASYTWSHAIDDSTDLQTLQEPQDDSLPGLERGNSNFDQRHRFVLSGVYDIPSPEAAAARALFGNWKLAPVVEMSSGRPYNLTTNHDQTLVNNDTDARPSVMALGTPGSYPSPDGKVGLILPPAWSIGTLGRNVYRTPAFYMVDLQLAKHIPLREALSLDFIADGFNILNHPNVREVDNSYTNQGRPVAAYDPRQLQFGLKLNF